MRANSIEPQSGRLHTPIKGFVDFYDGVFFKTEDGHTTIVIVYVADFLISAKQVNHLNSLRSQSK
jgi:hypothetical protein